MYYGTWPIVVAALVELFGISLFSAGYWMVNDLRGELLGRDPEAEHKDLLFPGMACVVLGLILAFGMFAVQVAAAAITMMAAFTVELAVSHVLIRRRRIRQRQEFTAILRKYSDEEPG